MQLNPARGRKHTIVALKADDIGLGLCSSTPRGDGNQRLSDSLSPSRPRGLCSSTPRGDGNLPVVALLRRRDLGRFMQLNPARGRKHRGSRPPRHGPFGRFMQLNPARGRKRVSAPRLSVSGSGLCSSTPRGDGNVSQSMMDRRRTRRGLCSSTPRGDGNRNNWNHSRTKHEMVYAAQPREGTET